MKPNRHNRVLSDERRLNGGQKTSKWATKGSIARDEAKRAAELEKSRERLAEALDQFIKFLTDTTLPENRSVSEREQQTKLLASLPRLGSDLNKRNLEEGSMVIASTCLNSILVLRDEINKLKYQNYFLKKRVDELESKFKDPQKEDGSKDDSTSV